MRGNMIDYHSHLGLMGQQLEVLGVVVSKYSGGSPLDSVISGVGLVY